MELTKDGKPRRRRAKGHDPSIAARVPESVVDTLRAEAARRGTVLGVITREAIVAYVSNLGRGAEAQAA